MAGLCDAPAGDLATGFHLGECGFQLGLIVALTVQERRRVPDWAVERAQELADSAVNAPEREYRTEMPFVTQSALA
jgi:hypothetical protein